MRSSRHITSKLPRNINKQPISRIFINPHTTRKMSLFGPRFYNTPEYSPNFGGLFRLIDDFDKYASQTGEGQVSRQGRHLQPFITPKFDLHEDEAAYHLNGELPGVPKENVHIEFSDDQTISIRGKVERSYQSGAPPSLEGAQTGGAITEGGENKHHATVEDAPEGAKSKEVTKSEDKNKQAAASKTKYWVSERSVGEFSRSFNFPTRIDTEGVKASMENGILNVTVPKAKKAETKRVTVS
ncbi:HSP20-like chaperone [Whalleya microplaca]|nr:HSP20-like chaperone [Whalleya microplaca]